jgi:hypothetical protein
MVKLLSIYMPVLLPMAFLSKFSQFSPITLKWGCVQINLSLGNFIVVQASEGAYTAYME